MGTGQQADCGSRIYIQRNQFSRFSLMEIGQLQLVPNECIYQGSRTTWTCYHRPICGPNEHQSLEVLQLASGPGSRGDRSSPNQGEEGQPTLILVVPEWPSQIWYSTLLNMLIDDPIVLPQLPNLLLSPTSQPHPLVVNKTLRLLACKVSGLSRMTTRYRLALEFSWNRLSRQQQFAPTGQLSQQLSVAGGRGYDPFKLPTNLILEYLKDLFEEKSHSSINTARSALSFYLERREGMRVGELSDIARLCRGAVRLHPRKLLKMLYFTLSAVFIKKTKQF